MNLQNFQWTRQPKAYTVSDDQFTLKTDRLVIQPFSNFYLEDYYREFTDEIAKYQYPDRFPDMETARQVVSGFVADMQRGEMLELVILTRDGEFLGSLEVFGLREETPELGLWLKEKSHGVGYGYEALKSVIAYLNETKKYACYIYEVDVGNTPSVRLVEKFQHEKGDCEEVTTESGKKLRLQTYRIFGQIEGNKQFQ